MRETSHRDARPPGPPGTTGPGRDLGVGKQTLVAALPAQPLPGPLRATLEASLGTDLSGVRVSEDASLAAIGARAHARGLHLVFAPGAYRPETPAGQALIAHEVVHLVQQAERPVEATGQVGGVAVNADRGLEQEADELGARALRGEPVRTASAAPRASNGPIQGMFEDLTKLFDPVVDAASDLWDAVTGGGSHGLRVGDASIVRDPDARVRDRAAGWKNTGATIPLGTAVTIVEIDGSYVRLEGSDGTAWGWTKTSNLEGGPKPKGGSGKVTPEPTEPAGPTPDPAGPEGPRPAPELPSSDDEWQDVMTEARADVAVTQRFSIPTRALNPDLLFAIRTAKVENRDTFYNVLTNKHESTKGKAGSELTPGRLAYRLGDELQARAEAGAAVPDLLASKLALIDKAAPSGAIEISKNAGGTLHAMLGKGLGKPAQASIRGWIQAHYEGKKLIVSATEAAELRTLVTTAVLATAADPARDARIEALRADVVTCEARVRGVLRAKASETKAGTAQALWTRLADLAESAGVFVDRTLESYQIEAEDGSVTTLDPALAISVNYLNPGGMKNGGGKYREATIDEVLTEEYAGDPAAADKSSAAKKFIHTLNRNEGGPASMNTWDGEIVSAGPGLSGSGRLQKSMFEYKEEDPAGFHDALGKFGVNIVSTGHNPYFTVRVPTDVNAIPPAMRAVVTPGEVIIGSASTGAKKSSDKYEECAALRYISKDPLLMSRFMYAGQHSYQRFLLKEAAASMHKAESFSFLVGEQRIGWTALISPLGQDWLGATEAVIAYRYHASSSIYEALKVKAAEHYRSSFGADRAPSTLTTEERKQIGRFVAWQLKPGKYKVFREQFATVASDVFPPAKEKKAKGGKAKEAEPAPAHDDDHESEADDDDADDNDEP